MTKSCDDANASGIIVSASIARIAPAATAIVPAITSALTRRNTVYPTSDAAPETTAMAVQT